MVVPPRKGRIQSRLLVISRSHMHIRLCPRPAPTAWPLPGLQARCRSPSSFPRATWAAQYGQRGTSPTPFGWPRSLQAASLRAGSRQSCPHGQGGAREAPDRPGRKAALIHSMSFPIARPLLVDAGRGKGGPKAHPVGTRSALAAGKEASTIGEWGKGNL